LSDADIPLLLIIGLLVAMYFIYRKRR